MSVGPLRGRCGCNAIAYEVSDGFVEILDDLPQYDEYPWS